MPPAEVIPPHALVLQVGPCPRAPAPEWRDNGDHKPYKRVHKPLRDNRIHKPLRDNPVHKPMRDKQTNKQTN